MACGPESTPQTPIDADHSSPYLCLATESKETICRANLALLDAQVDYVASMLGVAPPDECIATLWTEEAAAECGPYKGCYKGGIIYSYALLEACLSEDTTEQLLVTPEKSFAIERVN